YYSADGISWTRITGAKTINMAATAQAGLAVTAHNDGTLATATFQNVAVQAQVSLAGAFNQVGITANSNPAAGNLDGTGNSYSWNMLGTRLTDQGVDFALRAGGGNNAVQTAGQTVALPAGSFRTLAVLGTGVNGSQSGTFTVLYTDGTRTTFTQTFSDWTS